MEPVKARLVTPVTVAPDLAAVISVTEPLVKYFQQLTHRQVSLIPNGFDEDDFTPTKNKHKSKDTILLGEINYEILPSLIS